MKATIRKKFSNWIFQTFSVSPEGLGLYRIFVALFILCFLLPPVEMYGFLGSIPPDFFSPPPGPMWLLDGFPAEEIFIGLHIVLILSLVCLLLGYKTSVASILTGLILLCIKGFFYSLGKINHDLLLSILPIVMAFSGWGVAYSVDSFIQKDRLPTDSEEVESWPLVLLALFIGFMMFTAGFAKLLGGWLDCDSQATLGHFFNQFFVKGRQDLWANQILNIDNRFLWEILDYATVLFEIGFLLAIVHSRSMRLFISFAVIFHFSIMMTMNISFLHNFPAYAAFINWSFINRIFKKWGQSKATPVIVVGSVFIILGILSYLGNFYDVPRLKSDLTIHEFYIVLVALFIVLTYLGVEMGKIVVGSRRAENRKVSELG